MKTTLFNSPTTRDLDGSRTIVGATVRGRSKTRRSSIFNLQSSIFTFLLLFLGLGFSTQAWAGVC